MKQRRYGKKVYNWHRPLGRFELRRRFLRARDTAKSLSSEFSHSENDTDPADLGIWPYEIADYCCETCYQESVGYADEEDRSEFSFRQIIDSLLQPTTWQTELDAVKASLHKVDLSQTWTPNKNSDSIEERLVKHINQLMSVSQSPTPIQNAIELVTQDSRRPRKISQKCIETGSPQLARMILLFSPFWLRDPLDSPQDQSIFELLSFLFIEHETPGFLFPAWLEASSISEVHLKWLIWFILIGQGGSLKRASKHFDWAVPKNLQRHLVETPDHFSPEDAAMLAEVKRLGGTMTAYRRLAQFAYFNFDPTDPRYLNRSFWEETLRWLVKHEEQLTDDDSHDILQWAIHEKTENDRAANNQRFTWKNRSVAACRLRTDAYFDSLNQHSPVSRWKGQDWNKQFTDEYKNNWNITELTSSAALAEEGRTMRHCVSTYSYRCQNGYSAIFSLKKNNVRTITIEVAPSSKKILQARGKLNRPANEVELAAIKQWINHI
ncbi:PcfJ domain-containing protein [Puniceicoccaceae bacterium K14]|nr:PcfJ domain-containing protein [Puniceicoccaceae bacterium K14]